MLRCVLLISVVGRRAGRFHTKRMLYRASVQTNQQFEVNESLIEVLWFRKIRRCYIGQTMLKERKIIDISCFPLEIFSLRFSILFVK